MLSGMKAIDAAYEVLREAGEPLGARVIAERSIARGLWETKGKTPWNTVARDIQADIKENGERSRFRKVARGTFEINPAYVEPSGASPNAPMSVAASSAATATRTAGPMSFLDAAERILWREGRALHYEDIMQRAMDENLVQTEGQTPAGSLNAQIHRDIRRREARGDLPRFTDLGTAKYGLAAWQPQGLASEISERNGKVRAELLERAKQGTPTEFEQLIGKLLEKMGFKDVKVTPPTNDRGLDVLGTLVVDDVVHVHIQVAVQAKRWAQNVQAPDVNTMLGSMSGRKIVYGMIITTSDFSTGARERASDFPHLALVNGEELAKLLAEHEVGVKREKHTLFRLIEPDEPTD